MGPISKPRPGKPWFKPILLYCGSSVDAVPVPVRWGFRALKVEGHNKRDQLLGGLKMGTARCVPSCLLGVERIVKLITININKNQTTDKKVKLPHT